MTGGSASGSALPTFSLPRTAGTLKTFEYLEPLPAFVPPETCQKGCCLLEDAFANCKIGRKRGQLMQDASSLTAVKPAKLVWGGFEAPAKCEMVECTP